MRVSWLKKEEIAESAAKVITDYQEMLGHSIEPPIPIENIIERYLDLRLSYEDLVEKLGVEDVLGATYVKSRRVFINMRLLDDKSEGRLIFTCAHEAGHWVLHRRFVDKATRGGSQNSEIICRTKDAREPIEWQADYFASCLLMPEDNVKDAFSAVCDKEALVLNNIKSSFGGTAVCIDPCVQNWHLIADMTREAGGFMNVSKLAMIIRMQELGLVVNLTGTRIGWGETSHS